MENSLSPGLSLTAVSIHFLIVSPRHEAGVLFSAPLPSRRTESGCTIIWPGKGRMQKGEFARSPFELLSYLVDMTPKPNDEHTQLPRFLTAPLSHS